ncbi:MAG: hypothetical protein ACP5GA_10075, partial [Acidithiobacillus sp.]
GTAFRVHWQFLNASREVQAFPHVDLPWRLPLQWASADEPPVQLSWRNHCTGFCRDDLGFDFWLSPSRRAAPFRYGDGMEVMVLPEYRSFPPPESAYLGMVTISGAGWSVYRFRVGNGWPLLQVIGPAGASGASLNPLSVLQDLAQSGWIPERNRFVTVANLGVEIVSGAGSVEIRQ